MMTRALRFVGTLVLGAVVAVAPLRADAQPSDAEMETARAHFFDGCAKLEAKDYEGARKVLQAAHDIMGVPTTGFALAQAHEGLGRLIEARNIALKVTQYLATSNQPVAYTDAITAANALANALETRIPSIVISVTGIEKGVGPTVTLDGAAIPLSILNLPRKVDPGTYTVMVTAPGYAKAIHTVQVKERETVPVHIKMTQEFSSSVEPYASSALPEQQQQPPPQPPPEELLPQHAQPPPPTTPPAPQPTPPAPPKLKQKPHPPRPAPQPASDEAPTTEPERSWYGWQTMIALGLAGAVATPIVMASDDKAAGATIAATSASLIGPIVHWSHGNVGRGFGSALLYGGLTAGGALVGGLATDAGGSGTVPIGVGLGAGGGLLVATIIDVSALTYDQGADAPREGRRAPRLAVRPTVDLRSGRQVVGLAGTF